MVKAGAATETEVKERKHRIEDAVSATKAAVAEGIIAGGGSALIHAASALDADLGLTGDQALGVAIVRRALSAPAYRIAANAGVEGSVIVAQIAAAAPGHGYNAATGEMTDLLAAGVVDPVKVTRSAVENAASIAGMVLTTESTVTDIPEAKPAAPAGGHRH